MPRKPKIKSLDDIKADARKERVWRDTLLRSVDAAAKTPSIIAMSAPVSIEAAVADGEKKGPAKFTATFYTGGPLNVEGWDKPIVIDLEGLEQGKVLVANLDHDRKQRVGNFVVANDGKSLVANGTATAATAARKEVVDSALDGYQWQSSLEVNPTKIESVKAGEKVAVNGQSLEGPLYVARKGVLKGFAFVGHGADDNTNAFIAAAAATHKEQNMDQKLKAWIEAMLPGTDVDHLSEEAIANLTANYNGQNGKKTVPVKASNPFDARKAEAKRRIDITAVADSFAKKREDDLEYIEAVEKMRDHAIEAEMSTQDFRNEMYESMVPLSHTVPAPKNRVQATEKVIEAALAMAGRLNTLEKHFDEPTLEAASKQFRDGITLSELMYICAEAKGYNGRRSGRITQEVQNAAFAKPNGQSIHAQGFSTISIANILSNNQNKFLREGWMSVDRTIMEISAIRSVTDFREITTVNLTGGLMFEKVGPAGEIKHGTLGDMTYGNKAETYAIMLAITRQDMINDDLGALNAVPRRIGRGGALKLNDIGWTEFLNNSSFFTSGNVNVNTGVADMTTGGLAATEAIFLAQTDPNGYPLATSAAILLVPTALKGAADSLMTSDRMLGSSGPDGNIWKGRFRVLSSTYMSNSSYTGYSAAAWYMLANPSDVPVIEIVALNGRVEPTVDTADTDFNTLGVQFRGYSDVGIRLQEYRGGVRADGGAS